MSEIQSREYNVEGFEEESKRILYQKRLYKQLEDKEYENTFTNI